VTAPISPRTSALIRTRLSWIRTALATLVIGFLLVRGSLTGSEAPALAVLAGLISITVIAVALGRSNRLGGPTPTPLVRSLPMLVAFGTAALAAIGCARMILPS
jgi:uncharacterized membrane protein YidH (DUF202 family)